MIRLFKHYIPHAVLLLGLGHHTHTLSPHPNCAALY